MRKWQRYTQEFKDQAVARLKGCTNVDALARELQVSRGILYLWRDKQEGRPPASKRPGPVVDSPTIAALKKEMIQLKVALADKALESRFFQRSLAKSRGSSPTQRNQWRSGIYEHITEVMPSLQGKLSVERMCMLAQVSRAGFYRWLKRKQPGVEETAVRAKIQEVAVEHHRRYGYRRITAELRHRGMLVNRKRVLRMMQEDNLLAIRRRKFVSYDRFAASIRGISQPRATNGTHCTKPALGSRSHLYPSYSRSSFIWRWCWMHFQGVSSGGH